MTLKNLFRSLIAGFVLAVLPLVGHSAALYASIQIQKLADAIRLASQRASGGE